MTNYKFCSVYISSVESKIWLNNFTMPTKGKSAKTLQMAGEEGVSPGGFGEGALILLNIRRLGTSHFRGFKFIA